MTHALLTGPIKGSVTLADGTVVDINHDVIHLDSEAQVAEVCHLIGQRLAVEGHPAHEPGQPFVYIPSEV